MPDGKQWQAWWPRGLRHCLENTTSVIPLCTFCYQEIFTFSFLFIGVLEIRVGVWLNKTTTSTHIKGNSDLSIGHGMSIGPCHWQLNRSRMTSATYASSIALWRIQLSRRKDLLYQHPQQGAIWDSCKGESKGASKNQSRVPFYENWNGNEGKELPTYVIISSGSLLDICTLVIHIGLPTSLSKCLRMLSNAFLTWG